MRLESAHPVKNLILEKHKFNIIEISSISQIPYNYCLICLPTNTPSWKILPFTTPVPIFPKYYLRADPSPTATTIPTTTPTHTSTPLPIEKRIEKDVETIMDVIGEIGIPIPENEPPTIPPLFPPLPPTTGIPQIDEVIVSIQLIATKINLAYQYYKILIKLNLQIPFS